MRFDLAALQQFEALSFGRKLTWNERFVSGAARDRRHRGSSISRQLSNPIVVHRINRIRPFTLQTTCKMANFANICHTPRKRCPMATMNVSLPDPMKDWVEQQVRTGQYSNASDYVRDLIRRDQEYLDKREILVKALLVGEQSGKSKDSLDDVWKRVKARHGIQT
jgi:antitoxin ParD1/3/4